MIQRAHGWLASQVKEALMTSALLRLPRTVPAEDKRRTVQSVLEVLVGPGATHGRATPT